MFKQSNHIDTSIPGGSVLADTGPLLSAATKPSSQLYTPANYSSTIHHFLLTLTESSKQLLTQFCSNVDLQANFVLAPRIDDPTTTITSITSSSTITTTDIISTSANTVTHPVALWHNHTGGQPLDSAQLCAQFYLSQVNKTTAISSENNEWFTSRIDTLYDMFSSSVANLDSQHLSTQSAVWFGANSDTDDSQQSYLSANFKIILVAFLSLMIASTVIGNILVCLSVILVRKLRHPSNYLLVSLAISDLCVAILVMPLALQYELSRSWNLTPAICDLWVSFDVTCCTSSILNLCTISIDRYLAITKPLTYGVRRTTKRILSFIAAVWIASCLISIPPVWMLGNEHGTTEQPMCEVSQNFAYQLYATLSAFYIPLLVMIALYYKIYVAAKRVVEAELRDQRPSSTQTVSLLRNSRSNGSGNQSSPPHLQTSPKTECLRVYQPLRQHRPSPKHNSSAVPYSKGVANSFTNNSPANEFGKGKIESQTFNSHHQAQHQQQKPTSDKCCGKVKGAKVSNRKTKSKKTKKTKGQVVISSNNNNNNNCGTSDKDCKRSADRHRATVFRMCCQKTMSTTPIADRKCFDSNSPNQRPSTIESCSTPADNQLSTEFSFTSRDQTRSVGQGHSVDSPIGLNNNVVNWSHPQLANTRNSQTVINGIIQLQHNQPKQTQHHHQPHHHQSHWNRSNGSNSFLHTSINRLSRKKKSMSNSSNSGEQCTAPLAYKRRASNALRERKASFTLGIIMTAFTVCWLPFFILALIRPFSESIVQIPRFVNSVALWLGYANSMLNPIIYVTFHQDFRRAFKYLLCLQCSTMGSRLRAEAYLSQYGNRKKFNSQPLETNNAITPTHRPHRMATSTTQPQSKHANTDHNNSSSTVGEPEIRAKCAVSLVGEGQCGRRRCSTDPATSQMSGQNVDGDSARSDVAAAAITVTVSTSTAAAAVTTTAGTNANTTYTLNSITGFPCDQTFPEQCANIVREFPPLPPVASGKTLSGFDEGGDDTGSDGGGGGVFRPSVNLPVAPDDSDNNNVSSSGGGTLLANKSSTTLTNTTTTTTSALLDCGHQSIIDHSDDNDHHHHHQIDDGGKSSSYYYYYYQP